MLLLRSEKLITMMIIRFVMTWVFFCLLFDSFYFIWVYFYCISYMAASLSVKETTSRMFIFVTICFCNSSGSSYCFARFSYSLLLLLFFCCCLLLTVCLLSVCCVFLRCTVEHNRWWWVHAASGFVHHNNKNNNDYLKWQGRIE